MAASNHKCISFEELRAWAIDLWEKTSGETRESVFFAKLSSAKEHPPSFCSSCERTWDVKFQRLFAEKCPKLDMRAIGDVARMHTAEALCSWDSKVVKEITSARFYILPSRHHCEQTDIDHIESWMIDLWNATTGDHREFIFQTKAWAAFNNPPKDLCDWCYLQRSERFLGFCVSEEFFINDRESINMVDIMKDSGKTNPKIDDNTMRQLKETQVTFKI